ncbi:MAG: hypothetical protein H6652_27650 [Ardenticatenaceae bacterium]|nr:hypothetical protein [Ardenticatenaceae bacterium]MCB8948077.1 hypothetical protein [Ardenticatenaceae bacterium]
MTQKTVQTCFNCERTDDEIPIVMWSFQQRPLTVCSACMPLLIHKWEQVVTTLNQMPTGETNE